MTLSMFSKKFIFLRIAQQDWQISKGLMVTHWEVLQGFENMELDS